MKRFKIFFFFSLLASLVLTISCDKNNDLVIFSIENDKQLGEQVAAEIAATDTLDILSPSEYPQVYNYLNDMKEDILISEDVTYKEEFVWKLHVINEDVLNAFATPGGYIYIYTGLIKYLQDADALAGVLGHEIAHADQRHSVKQLQKTYGITVLLSIALGNDPSQLAQIAAQIAGTLGQLKFSRDDEAEADEFSVKYLEESPYACNGAAMFFQKLIEEEQAGRVPQFLSTHPSPANRVEDINELADELGCDTSLAEEGSFTYEDLQNALP